MIGRNAAVAEVGPHHHELTGPFTFAAWLGIDALLLTTNRAKIDAFLEWAWDYKNYCGRHGSHSRLVCGSRIFSPAENSDMGMMAFVICFTTAASFPMWIRRLSSGAVRVPTRSAGKASQWKAASGECAWFQWPSRRGRFPRRNTR
jgi:hypothetical protein